jgi:hypothetical protein
MPTRKIGRDASSGRFISVTAARERPATSVVETVHVSRNGVRRLKRRSFPEPRPRYGSPHDAHAVVRPPRPRDVDRR